VLTDLGGRGRLSAVARFGHGLGHRVANRIALVETRLERTPQLFAGHADVEPGPPRLELDEAHVVVALAVAPCIALGLGQRAQPHESTVLPGPGSVKNPQALWESRTWVAFQP
jgi:hypothetical protein